jgi:predicted ester cyclase
MSIRMKSTVVISVLIIFAGASQMAWADTAANKALEGRLFEEVWNQSTIGVIDEIISDDCIIHDSSGKFKGYEGYQQFHGMFNAAFSNIHFAIEDQLAEGDLVVTRWLNTATHTGELMGVPATGTETVSAGMTLSRHAEGKIVEQWNVWDLVGLLEQIGAKPAWRDYYGWGEPSEKGGDPGDPLSNKMIIIRSTEGLNNQKQVSALDETMSVDLALHNPNARPLPKNFDEYKKSMLNFMANMPDMHTTTHAIVAEGDRVAAFATTTGTTLNNSTRFAFDSIIIHRIADGQVIENWWMLDNYAMMNQAMAPEIWPLDGIWVSTVPTPMGNLVMTTMYVAQDAAKTRYSGSLDIINPMPLLGEIYPVTDPPSKYAGGEAKLVGPNKYEATYLAYETKTIETEMGEMSEFVGLYTIKAYFELLDPDTLQGHGTGSYYLAEQDADRDGFPDEGQEPVACVPWAWTGKRLTPVPGCTPPPLE